MRGTQKAGVPLGLKYHHVDVFSSNPLSGNGVTVFRLRESLPVAVMQGLTREMRQFESIFVLQEARSRTVRAWVFTMEEELDFAGHPVLGAAAALHEETMLGIRKVSWTFQLNKKSFPVKTTRQGSHYRAEMDQGVCSFGAVLSPHESVAILDALNLGRDHLLDQYPLQIASTGLPYLLVPVDRDLDAARIVKPELEKQLARFGAKFIYVFDLNRREGRTWDNDGRVEDIATGSDAGPVGAYLVAHGLVSSSQTIEISQGRFVGRPSILFVVARKDDEGRISVKVAGDASLFARGQLEF
jgi:trans-2,3-dihydro-3-hydroxyanthranilate isomerase